jgi:DMSO/TMAO reductase YedYZ molybdopterin-dependent catalytic subunit
MRFSRSACSALGAALLTLSALAATAVAAPTDYRFELAQAQPAGPGKTDLTVRLIHVPDKKPVAGAVLFETKADMTPERMADMSGKVTPVPADQPGLYRFQVETGMAGKWQLSLGAKVQGETGTVRGIVPFAAAK